jgi:hypothetical protein
VEAAKAEFDCGAEKAMKRTDIGPLDEEGTVGCIGEAFGKGLLEVIVDFAFELDVRNDRYAEANAKSRKIGVGLAEMKIVTVGADFGLSMS